jgi:hypothetical protein
MYLHVDSVNVLKIDVDADEFENLAEEHADGEQQADVEGALVLAALDETHNLEGERMKRTIWKVKD